MNFDSGGHSCDFAELVVSALVMAFNVLYVEPKTESYQLAYVYLDLVFQQVMPCG